MEQEPNNITGFFRNRTIMVITSVVLVVLAIFIAAQTIATIHTMFMPTSTPANTITVSGKGTATSTPNLITLSYSVSATAATVATAQGVTTKIGNKAIAFLKRNNITNTNIKTTSYTITPNYVREVCANGRASSTCTRQKLSGYHVSQNVSVKVTHLGEVGTLLQGLGQIGVTGLYAGSPQVANPTAYKNLARTKAIAQARTNALTLSQELGVHLGRLVRFNQYTNQPRPLYISNKSERLSSNIISSGPTIPLGENTFTSNVTLIYAIY